MLLSRGGAEGRRKPGSGCLVHYRECIPTYSPCSSNHFVIDIPFPNPAFRFPPRNCGNATLAIATTDFYDFKRRILTWCEVSNERGRRPRSSDGSRSAMGKVRQLSLVARAVALACLDRLSERGGCGGHLGRRRMVFCL